MPGEGKTTTASNLAVAFANQGLRVVLIDGDMRKARVHDVFGFGREPGLADILAGLIDVDNAVRESPVANLAIITAGTLPPNPAELLGGTLVKELTERLSETYDMIIFDAPPVLVLGDASILASMADGVIVVVRAGQTDHRIVQAAVHQLKAVGARVLGAVLNDPDSKVPVYGGYYY